MGKERAKGKAREKEMGRVRVEEKEKVVARAKGMEVTVKARVREKGRVTMEMKKPGVRAKARVREKDMERVKETMVVMEVGVVVPKQPAEEERDTENVKGEFTYHDGGN